MKTFTLLNLGCNSCADKMERKVKQIKGVSSAQINFITSKLLIEYDEENEAEILEKVQKVISKVEPECALEVL